MSVQPQCGVLAHAETAHGFFSHRLRWHCFIRASSLRLCAWTATSVTPSVSACAGPTTQRPTNQPLQPSTCASILEVIVLEKTAPTMLSRFMSGEGISVYTDRKQCLVPNFPTWPGSSPLLVSCQSC